MKLVKQSHMVKSSRNTFQSIGSQKKKLFHRIMTWALVSGLLAFLIVPLLVPFHSSGELTYREAAGADATFLEVSGVDVHVEFTPFSGSTELSDPSQTPATASKNTQIPGADVPVPVFILLHGFGASTFSWREVVTPLSQLGDVVAYDRPAFGFTERPVEWLGENPYGYRANVSILNAVIDAYANNREVILVGHSAGGQFAAAYAEEFPDRVQRLVLVDPAIYSTGGVPEGWSWLLDIPQIDRLGPFAVQRFASAGIDILYRSFYNPSLITEEILAGYQAPLTVAGWEQGLWEFTKAPGARGVVEGLSTIEQPTLIISGEDDTIVPLTDSQKLAEDIPNSTFIIITQSGHLPHEEQPQAFVHSVTEWLTP